MDETRFDRFTRSLATLTRREALRDSAAAAVALAGFRGMIPERAEAAACYQCGGQCVPLCGANCPAFPASCRMFPADHIWNVRVDSLPVHARSDQYVDTIGRWEPLHPDFGSGLWDGKPIGIPMTVKRGALKKTRVRFNEYGDESDAGPYYIPPDALVEAGSCGSGDRHVLVVDTDRCRLYELYHARPGKKGRWTAGSGAIWDLNGYQQRPEGWTSVDASGMALLPGLVRYEEVAHGRIAHALRFTVEDAAGHVWPATHMEENDETSAIPAMGHRFRLKAGVDISRFSPEVRVILTALKEYGMMIADIGSPWFLSGAPDERWNIDALVALQQSGGITGNDFECVDQSGLMISHDSARARV